MIKGSIVSRPMESILNDAIILQEHGVQEINLIAQDITDYKFDQNNKNGLVELLQKHIKSNPFRSLDPPFIYFPRLCFR